MCAKPWAFTASLGANCLSLTSHTPVGVRCVNVCCLKWVTALSAERRFIHSLEEKLLSDVMQAFSVCACCFTSQIYLKISDTHNNKAGVLFPHTCLLSASAFLMRQSRMTGDWFIITQHEFMSLWNKWAGDHNSWCDAGNYSCWSSGSAVSRLFSLQGWLVWGFIKSVQINTLHKKYIKYLNTI